MALGSTFTKRQKVLRSAETMKEKEYLIDLFENPVRFLEWKYGYYVPETRKPIRHKEERKFDCSDQKLENQVSRVLSFFS